MTDRVGAAWNGIERYGDHGAQSLHDDTLRALQIISAIQVFGDYRGALATCRMAVWLGVMLSGSSVRASAATRQANFERAFGVGLEQQAAVGVGDGHGVVEHGAQHGIQRQRRMQKRGGFEQQVELAQAAGQGGLSGGDGANARQHGLHRLLAGTRAEGNARALFDAELDHVAVDENSLGHFVPVDEQALAMAPVLKDIADIGRDDGGAAARDARIGELQMVAGIAPATNEKGRVWNGNHLRLRPRSDQFQYGFSVLQRIRHAGPSLIFRRWCNRSEELHFRGWNSRHGREARSRLSRIALLRPDYFFNISSLSRKSLSALTILLTLSPSGQEEFHIM